MAINKDQAKELLGQGLSSEVVGAALGCAPAYILELMQDEVFRNDVSVLRVKNTAAHAYRDRSIDDIEDNLISTLADRLKGNEGYMKTRDLLSAFRIVNGARRRGAPPASASTINNTVINLQLPRVAVKQFTISEQGEVLAVEGETLITMPTNQLLRTLAQKGDAATYARVGRHIPSAQGGDAARDIESV